jgi:glucoamylase
MPLLWTHAEFLKLRIARESGRPLELFQVVQRRYAGAGDQRATAWHWRDEVPVTCLEKGLALLIEDRKRFTLCLGFDGWRSTHCARRKGTFRLACGRMGE